MDIGYEYGQTNQRTTSLQYGCNMWEEYQT